MTRTRLAFNVRVVAIAWPLLTIAGAALERQRLPYYTLPWPKALGAAIVGTLLLVPDLVLVGLLFAVLSTWLFGRLAGSGAGVGRPRWGEPMLLFLALNLGIALWYPGTLGLSVVSIPELPAWCTIAALIVLVVLGSLALSPDGGVRLAAALIAVGVLLPVPAIARSRLHLSSGGPPAIVILGLDSVSMKDDVEPLRQWTMANSGAWYEKAVTPGLLTNAVWSSILTEQPVSQHGVFHTNQHLAAERATLLRRAEAQGIATVSFFFDQQTCTVGSESGFRVDRSSPMGWRQLLIPIVANSSILVPAIKPLLPNGWSALGPNEVGLYSYSLERSFREVLTAQEGTTATVVMAHTAAAVGRRTDARLVVESDDAPGQNIRLAGRGSR